MIKTWRCLGRSLVRRLCYRSTIGMVVLTFCAFLPFVSFGDLVPDDMLFYYWPYYYVRGGSSPALFNPSSYDTSYAPIPASSLDSYFFTHRFSVLLNPDGTLYSPLPSTSLTNSTKSASYTLQALDGSGWYNPVRICPSLLNYASLASRLFFYGYQGPGIDTVGTNSNNGRISFNLNPSLLFGEALYGTNYLYRQILISHLSNINSSVQNIELNVSGLQSSIDEGNNIISNIDLNVSSIDSNLVSLSSNTVAGLSSVSSSLSSLENIGGSISSVVDIFHSDFAMNNLDVFLGDDTQTWIDFLNLCQSSGLLSSDDVSSYISELQATDPSRSKSYTIPMQHRRFYVKNQIKHTCVEAQKLRGRYQSFYQQVNNPDTVVSRAVREVLYNHVTYPINSGFASTIGDWRDDLRQQLQDWKHSDETGYLNVRDFQKRNFEAPVPGSTNTVPFYSFLTNNITTPLTNVVRSSAADISSNIVEQSETTRSLLNDTLLNPEFDGVNVRIKYPIWGQDGAAVHVHDEALDAFSAGMADIQQALDALVMAQASNSSTNYYIAVTNLLFEILSSSTNRSYLLLDDYADYISNGVYQSSLEQFENDFPNVYTNLQKYGLTSSGNGNFWTLFGANLIYQSGLVGSLLDDMATIRKFADDHIEGGFAAGIKSIVDKFPSLSQLEDDVNNATSRLYEISLATTNLVLSFESVTNIAPSVFKPFADSFDSPPSGDIVFFKTANDQYVSIPVHEQASAWSLIRMGIGFALIGVQFLLFPKFVLFIVVLFERLSSRFVKFVPTDR